MIGSSVAFSMATNSQMATPNERPTLPAAMTEITFLDSRFPKTPFSVAPASGRIGISQSRLNGSISVRSLPLQQVTAINIQRFAIPEHRNDQRQANGSFGRRHNQDEENENL